MNTDESELERDQCKLNIAQTWVDSLRGLRGLRSLASLYSSDLRSDGPKTIFSRQYINCQRDLLRAGERDKTLLDRGKPRLLLLEQAIMEGKRKTYAVLTFFTGEILGNVVLVSS